MKKAEIQKEIVDKAKVVASKKGWELVQIRKFNNNPLDEYLSFVLCKRAENDYCTHLFNHDSGDGFFVEGHYDFKTYEEALKDFANRQ